jgi:hypothetical protein
MVLGLLAMAALAVNPRPAHAGCFTDLGDCYQKAANIDSFWYRWAAGLDCELDLIECTRGKVFGS